MKFSCPTCNGRFEAEREHLGTEIQCPHCGEGLALPAEIEIEGESTTAAPTSARSYWCFISYRHTDNKQEGRQWATWLHQAIETYEVPADLVGTRNELGEEIPSRIFPVFRDEEELPADADLSRPILRALHNSRYLVALCSPGAVSSRFVEDEITRFKAMGKSDRIIAAIIAGEPNAVSSSDPDLADRECFPKPLRYEVEADGALSNRPAEPIAADFRLEDGSEGWTSPEAYRVTLKQEGWKSAEIARLVRRYEKRLSLMTLKVIAGILGVELGVLTKRDKAYQLELARRRTAVLFGWLALAGVLAVAALVGSVVAIRNSREALAQRDQARYNEGLGWMLRAEVAEERGKRYPETLLYAAQAIGFEGMGRPENAGEQPIRYLRRDSDPEAFERAQNWIAEHPSYRPIWASELRRAPVCGLAISPSGRWLALANKDARTVLWDLSTEDNASVLAVESSPVVDLAFDPTETVLAIGFKHKLQIWDLESGRIAADHIGPSGSLAWSPDGEILAVGAPTGEISVRRGDAKELLAAGTPVPAARIAFSPENSFFVTAHPGQGVRMFFPHAGESAHAWMTDQGDAYSVGISPDSSRIAVGTGDGAVSLWDAAGAKQLGIVPPEFRHAGAVLDIAFHPSGGQIASASSDGTLKLWDVRNDTPALVVTLCGHVGIVSHVRYAPGGDILASAGGDGSARLWLVTGEKESEPNWFGYLDRSFYHFDPATLAAFWGGGSGYLEVPKGTLIAAWRTGGPSSVGNYLLEHGVWSAAFRLGGDPGRLRTALLADAEKAVNESRWHRVDLRLRQIDALGGADPDGKAHEFADARAAVARAGESFTNGEGHAMIWCPPTGSEGFLMGSPASEKGRHEIIENEHRVILTVGFWLGQHEVTQANWTEVMGSNPSTNIASGPGAPAENLSWHEALDYCRRLTDRERARGSIPRGWEYTLPTEAQWEYACRAGTTTRWSFGDDEKESYLYGNFYDSQGSLGSFVPTDVLTTILESDGVSADMSQDDGHQYTAPVGSYRPNPWGFYDMHGNVYEWCRDAVAFTTLMYPERPVTDPLGTHGPLRMRRGGGYESPSSRCRSALRSANDPTRRFYDLGLRPALVPAGPAVQYSE